MSIPVGFYKTFSRIRIDRWFPKSCDKYIGQIFIDSDLTMSSIDFFYIYRYIYIDLNIYRYIYIHIDIYGYIDIYIYI